MAQSRTPLFLLLALFITHNLSAVEAKWGTLQPPAENLGQGLVIIPGCKWVAVGDTGDTWAICQGDRILKQQNFFWIRQPGFLAQISVGAQGIWGVTGDTLSVFRWNGAGWDNIPGPQLRRIACGASVWGLSIQGNIYRYAGQGRWNPIPGNLKEITVSNAGDVWGINFAGDIYRRDFTRNVWEQIPGKLVSIAAGKGGVWGVNAIGNTYRYTASKWELRQTGEDGIVQVDFGDHYLVGVSSKGELFAFYP